MHVACNPSTCLPYLFLSCRSLYFSYKRELELLPQCISRAAHWIVNSQCGGFFSHCGASSLSKGCSHTQCSRHRKLHYPRNRANQRQTGVGHVSLLHLVLLVIFPQLPLRLDRWTGFFSLWSWSY